MGTGFLKIQLYLGDYALHGDSVQVLVKQNSEILHTLQTDENGKTEAVSLASPDLTDFDENTSGMVFEALCDVEVPAAQGFLGMKVRGVQIFDGITSVLNIHLEPAEPGKPPEDIVINVPPEHGVDIDRDNGANAETSANAEAAPALAEAAAANPPLAAANPPLANEVVIPDFITVHLGRPNVAARNVRVPFKEYIKNVVSSEIYPFWDRAAIEANTHAIVSFTLNRLFTHWYRSRGFAFDITNTTQFDQMFIEGREIFQNVALIVDEIWNQFIRRPGRTEPFFSSYCNGTTSTCAGMSQHGSQALARQGLTPIQILRRFYPADINIVQSTNFGPRNPGAYPGTALRVGSTGQDVRRMQMYLNRISGNWWIPAIRNPNGVFGEDTRATVVAFQQLFNLTPDGVIGPITWYEITRVYVAARNLAELISEGQRYSIGNNPPTTVVRLGARGEAVVELQFLLNFIASFYPELPFVVESGVYREADRAAVIEFQTRFGLAPDGVVGPLTWGRLYEVYRRIRNTVPLPPADPSIPPFPGIPLQNGTRSDDVRLMQTYLNAIGRFNPSIEHLTVDGIFGPRTQAAVREFQRLFGLTQDGIIGRDTWYRIVDEFNLLQGETPQPPTPPAPPTPPTPPPPSPQPTPPYPGTALRVGSRGENVRLMQSFLNRIARVYPIIPGNLAEDGIFGPITQASVAAFQTFFGLNPDGVIGPITWPRIVNVNASLPNITAPQFPGNLQNGSRGDNVRVLQQGLNDLTAFYPTITHLNTDGIFGPITQGSVTAFQRLFGMTASGVVNQTTWNLIMSMRNLLNAGNRTMAAVAEADEVVETGAFKEDVNDWSYSYADTSDYEEAAQQTEDSRRFDRFDKFALILALLLFLED